MQNFSTTKGKRPSTSSGLPQKTQNNCAEAETRPQPGAPPPASTDTSTSPTTSAADTSHRGIRPFLEKERQQATEPHCGNLLTPRPAAFSPPPNDNAAADSSAEHSRDESMLAATQSEAEDSVGPLPKRCVQWPEGSGAYAVVVCKANLSAGYIPFQPTRAWVLARLFGGSVLEQIKAPPSSLVSKDCRVTLVAPNGAPYAATLRRLHSYAAKPTHFMLREVFRGLSIAAGDVMLLSQLAEGQARVALLRASSDEAAAVHLAADFDLKADHESELRGNGSKSRFKRGGKEVSAAAGGKRMRRLTAKAAAFLEASAPLISKTGQKPQPSTPKKAVANVRSPARPALPPKPRPAPCQRTEAQEWDSIKDLRLLYCVYSVKSLAAMARIDITELSSSAALEAVAQMLRQVLFNVEKLPEDHRVRITALAVQTAKEKERSDGDNVEKALNFRLARAIQGIAQREMTKQQPQEAFEGAAPVHAARTQQQQAAVATAAAAQEEERKKQTAYAQYLVQAQVLQEAGEVSNNIPGILQGAMQHTQRGALPPPPHASLSRLQPSTVAAAVSQAAKRPEIVAAAPVAHVSSGNDDIQTAAVNAAAGRSGGPISLQEVQTATQACAQRLKLASRVLEDTVFGSFGAHGNGERHRTAIEQVEAMAVQLQELATELKGNF